MHLPPHAVGVQPALLSGAGVRAASVQLRRQQTFQGKVRAGVKNAKVRVGEKTVGATSRVGSWRSGSNLGPQTFDIYHTLIY